MDTGTRARTRWPLPDRVAAYGDEERFRAARLEAGQWVFWEDRVELVLQGRYDEVRPLHVELSPTYLCNFACPWCSCRSAREDWSEADVFNHPRATPLTVMRENRIDHVLDHLAEDKVGIMWVGGEPTMNPLLYPAALRAARLGLAQCLFTNGSLLGRRRVGELFDAGLVFVRVSLNAVTPEVHEVHHDYDKRRGYAERVLTNLRYLAETRVERGPGTLVGVSVVVDERNLADLGPTARYLCDLVGEYGPGAVDYAIFRPAFPFYSAQLDVRSDTVERFLAEVGPGSPWRVRMQEAGIDVVVPDGSGTPPAPPEPDGRGCLSAGWFGEVTPAGDLVVCSDRYGNPDYFVGNVAERGIGDLWNGQGRRAVLEMVRETECYATHCPSNGRGHFLNRVFREIEAFRREDRLPEVRAWIDDLRALLPRPAHSFFL
ncbi:radical SAM protein [Spongiactinospora sp. TRM90649]|uniref:radical SAM protein n=1 Tax=Spongiactinospora sp. TRM90649 TaxID=3031114 RepID=UPI0023F68BBE|nr:radical SAM protein [Spongiactinospora sp. TRM90649]MDF5756216.1 radical SAM protein [Spongiactinospora sp. TRM90649]